MNIIDIQQRTTLRIAAGTETGTGVIVQAATGGVCCIVTAKHVVTEEATGKLFCNSQIMLHHIITPSGALASYQLSENDKVFLAMRDLAVIVIAATPDVVDAAAVSQLRFINDNHDIKDCNIHGFPRMAHNEEYRTVNCVFDGFTPGDPSCFSIHTNQPLSSAYLDAGESVKGMSGGGLFFINEKEVYLLGVLTDYKQVNGFSGLRLETINGLLSTHSLPQLPETTPVVEKGLRDAKRVFKRNETNLKNKIQEHIGNLHLTREGSEEAARLIGTTQLVVITGAAGIGKSAFAKQAVDTYCERTGSHLLMFNGEQFSKDSVDEVLDSLKISFTADELFGLAPFQGDKVIWLESLEKLLEINRPEALIDLLNKAGADKSIKIFVTIRSYMMQRFMLRFGWNLPESKAFYEVPVLQAPALATVVMRFPELGPLMDNSKIRHLLAIPIYLKYAVGFLKTLKNADQLDERSFKAIIWDEVIDRYTGGRGRVFEKLAVKRAKEMSLFTALEKSEDTILQALITDNLVTVEDDDLKERYAPAHDVLEDFALIRFIRRHKKESSSPQEFFRAIGHEPAMRRAFRLWLSEELEGIDTILSNFIRDSVASPVIEKYWKDEIYIATLRSPHSSNYFTESEVQLLADEGRLIKRLIHLLKIACKDPMTTLGGSNVKLLVGSGWEAMVRFLSKKHQHLPKLYPEMLSFLLVWKQKISFHDNTLPPEAAEAASLLLDILGKLRGGYNGNVNRRPIDDDLEDGIKLVFRLSSLIPARSEAWLLEAEKGTDRSEDVYYQVRGFYEKVLNNALDGAQCYHLASVHPELLLDMLRRAILAGKAEEQERHGRSSWDYYEQEKAETYFGVNEDTDYRYSQASTYTTPLYFVLKSAPVAGLRFVIEVINQTTEHYRKKMEDKGDPLMQVELTLNNGSVVTQWGNLSLWEMYRGGGNTPNILQSLLMALETHLFDIAECGDPRAGKHLRDYFKVLLQESSSVATTALLSSVAMAFPDLVGDAMLPILSCKYCYTWDVQRYMGEMHYNLGAILPDYFTEERKNSAQRPHRSLYKGLQTFVAKELLIKGKYTEQIFGFIDRFLVEAADTNGDVVWKKTLSEMNLRQWQPSEVQDQPGMVVFEPGYEKEVKAFMNEGAGKMAQSNLNLSFSSTVASAYKQPDTSEDGLQRWRQAFQHYQSPESANSTYSRPATLAIVGVRDFADRISEQELAWAVKIICGTINSLAAERKELLYKDRHPGYNIMDVNPCLESLLVLYKALQGRPAQTELKACILKWIISPIGDHQAIKLIQAIRFHIAPLDPEFVKKCVYFLLHYVVLSRERNYWRSGQETDYEDERNEVEQIVADCLAASHTAIDNANLDFSIGSWLYRRAFLMIPYDTTDQQLIEFFLLFSCEVIEELADDDQRHRSGNFDHELAVKSHLPAVWLNLDVEMAERVAGYLYKKYHEDSLKRQYLFHVSKLQTLLLEILDNTIRALDSAVETPRQAKFTDTFWAVWRKIHSLNTENGTGHFAAKLLLRITWKDQARHWQPLAGKTSLLQEMMEWYGRENLSAAVSLPATIGDRILMPQSITVIASLLRESRRLADDIDRTVATKFIQRAFFDHGKAIKQNPGLLGEFIFILDILVDIGMTEAFLIRDYMISFKG